MFSLHWIAGRFPICFPDYVQASLFEVEPSKLAVVFEHSGKRGRWGRIGTERARAWSLDVDAETLSRVPCPPEIGKEWSVPFALDLNRNLIFETRHGLQKYVSWNARAGVVYQFERLPGTPVLINSRYLACTTNIDPGGEFVWYDLAELGGQRRSVPIMFTHGNVTPIPETNSFYFLLPAAVLYAPEYGADDGMDTFGESPDESNASNDYSEEWMYDDGSVGYELPPVVVNPSAPEPSETLVLMSMTGQGPKEVARWPVFGGNGSEVVSVPGHVICQSVDGRFLETHDARTGIIVGRVPIPKPATKANTAVNSKFEDWRAYGNLIDFDDGTGTRVAFDCTTGKQLNLPALRSATSGFYFSDNLNDESLLFVSQGWTDWTGKFQVYLGEQPKHEWKPPIPSYFSSHVHFTEDCKSVVFYSTDLRVLFVDKETGKVLRHVQPRFWVPFIAVAVIVSTFCWIISWFGVSVRCGVSVWFDEFVILLIALTFLGWRINLSGSPDDWNRIAWASIAALAIGVVLFVVYQAVLSDMRLLYRCAPIILLFVAAVFGQWKWMERQPAGNIVFELAIVVFVVLGSLAAHLLFFRTPHRARNLPASSQRNFSLLELFAWTALVALVLATLKLYRTDDWLQELTLQSLLAVLGLGSVITAVALLAFYLTVERCHLILRLIGLSILALLIAVLLAYRLNWIDFQFKLVGVITFESVAVACEPLLFLALGAVYVALPVWMGNNQKPVE